MSSTLLRGVSSPERERCVVVELERVRTPRRSSSYALAQLLPDEPIMYFQMRWHCKKLGDLERAQQCSRPRSSFNGSSSDANRIKAAIELGPSDAQQAHMSKVMEVLCQGPRSNSMFGSDKPDDSRDKCIRLLLERGADSFQAPLACRPVVSQIIREMALLPVYTSPAATRSCAPLLLLLRRIAVESQPSVAQQAHMSKVMEALCQVPRSNGMFGSDRTVVVRDECIRLLLERGADVFQVPLACRPVVSRIIQESVQLARVPQLVNEAIVGLAIARQQDQKP
ncbi:hypothetical protein FOA52_014754 [Chlamydomonas sp. UWO 241]|nr:hypothetical protein FOA52_014754 [Chlamydomonas sp. UWO 241]